MSSLTAIHTHPKIEKIKQDGLQSLHIVADFDRTLTNVFLNGKKSEPSWEVFMNAFSPEYALELKRQIDHYIPIELDPQVSIDEKKMKMREWPLEHLKLLLHHGVTQNLIDKQVRSCDIFLREGIEDFLKFTHEHNIPVLIFSAGLGDVITELFKDRNCMFPNMHIISNFFKFDTEGRAVGFVDDIISAYSKSEAKVLDKPYAKQIVKRHNVLLLGDIIGDIDMVKGIPHETVFKVGFLNGHMEQLDQYTDAFDMVIEEDRDMNDVVDLLTHLK